MPPRSQDKERNPMNSKDRRTSIEATGFILRTMRKLSDSDNYSERRLEAHKHLRKAFDILYSERNVETEANKALRV